MIEALAAFALAGNVLQFIELGIKLLLKTSEISKSGHGQTEELLELRNANNTLLRFNAELGLRLGQQKVPPPDHLVSLVEANQQCQKLAEDYLTLLSGLQVTGSGTTLANFRVAWKTLRSKDKLVRFEQRQQDLKSTLSLAFLEVIQHEVANNHGQSMQGLEDVKASLATEMDQIRDSTILAVTQMEQSLAGKIGNLSVNDTEMRRQLSSFHMASHRTLLELSDRIEGIENGCKTMADAQAKIYKSMIDQITIHERVRHAVLSTLRFSLMSNRKSQIVAAHSQTFRWILKPGMDNSTVWDDFIAWLDKEETSDLYWVQGKPGSGKSTLMKFLEHHLVYHEIPAKEPRDSQRFVVASYYFWSAGERSQRSVSGLLRTLLHSIFQAFPSQIQAVVRDERWVSSFYSSASTCEWTTDELFDTLTKALELLTDKERVFLLIDGLDEIEANDEEKVSLIAYFKKLALLQLAKICVSSRPWLIFKDDFEDFPQLLLEDLTRGDIQLYTQDTLSADKHFKRLQKTSPTILDDICSTIVTKAQGVFLWVRLAVRELINEVRDGAKEDRLLETLRSIPGDLDAFFLRILNSVDPKYRQDSAILLQVAICDLRSKCWKKGRRRPGPPSLKMFHLEWLDERQSPDFVASASFNPTAEMSKEHFPKLCANRQNRRITSRGMGLLETTKPSTSTEDDVFATEITFLHRTVRDWLLTPSASEILRTNAGRDYDAHLFRCSTLVLEAAARDARGLEFDIGYFMDSLTCLISQIPLRRSSRDLFEVFESFIKTSLYVKDINIWGDPFPESKHPIAENARYPQLNEMMDDIRDGVCTPWTIAVHLGWGDYVSERCIRQSITPRRDRPLLDYVLRPCLSVPCNPNLEAAISVIEYTRESASRSDFEETLRFVWPRFLAYICQIESFDRENCLRILKVLLQKPYANFEISPEQLLLAYGAAVGPHGRIYNMRQPSIFSRALSEHKLQPNGPPQRVIDIIQYLTHRKAPEKYIFEGSGLQNHTLWGARRFLGERTEEYIPPVRPGPLLFDADDTDSDCPDELDEDPLDYDEWTLV